MTTPSTYGTRSRNPTPNRTSVRVLGASIDALDWIDVETRLTEWARHRASRIVCICNVHSVVTATQDAEFAEIVNCADMATPDGGPVAWMLRRLGHPTQTRINGPDLMWRYCAQAASRGQSIYLYGGASATLDLLTQRLGNAFPNLRIAGMHSPPFRPLSDAEDAAIVAQINTCGASVVFVGLGCPKQEKWMAVHRGRIHAVMIGVGAAFDYHAGTLQRAPQWMQDHALEWFFRLVKEPRRLWRRYVITNALFVVLAARQLAMKWHHTCGSEKR